MLLLIISIISTQHAERPPPNPGVVSPACRQQWRVPVAPRQVEIGEFKTCCAMHPFWISIKDIHAHPWGIDFIQDMSREWVDCSNIHRYPADSQDRLSALPFIKELRKLHVLTPEGDKRALEDVYYPDRELEIAT